jgi:hypothetical protein
MRSLLRMPVHIQNKSSTILAFTALGVLSLSYRYSILLSLSVRVPVLPSKIAATYKPGG